MIISNEYSFAVNRNLEKMTFFGNLAQKKRKALLCFIIDFVLLNLKQAILSEF